MIPESYCARLFPNLAAFQNHLGTLTNTKLEALLHLTQTIRKEPQGLYFVPSCPVIVSLWWAGAERTLRAFYTFIPTPDGPRARSREHRWSGVKEARVMAPPPRPLVGEAFVLWHNLQKEGKVAGRRRGPCCCCSSSLSGHLPVPSGLGGGRRGSYSEC